MTMTATTRSGPQPPRQAKPPSSCGSRDLDVDIRTPSGHVRAVSSAGFIARAGQTLALLGESGCGKSMTAKAVAGLLDPVAHVAGGTVELERQGPGRLAAKQRRKFAGAGAGHRLPGRADRAEPRLHRWASSSARPSGSTAA